MAQETQTGALYQPRGVGWGGRQERTSKGRGYTCTYGYDQPRQHIKKQRHYFADKSPSRLGYGFSSSHVWMWELDYKGSWVSKNWYFWTMVLERLLKDTWTAWRSNQSILNEISPECSLEGLMLKLIYCFAFTVMLAEMKKLSNVSKWISFSGIPQLRKWQGLDFTQFCKVKHNLFKFAKSVPDHQYVKKG